MLDSSYPTHQDEAIVAALSDKLIQKLEATEPASEYASGRVIQKPMPTWEHSTIQGFLTAVLYPFLAEKKLGRILPEFRCIFGPPDRERTYVPDLSYVAQERLTGERYLHRAPDLAIEILSPGQHIAHLLDKIQFYLLHGVRQVWVIDPETSTVAVHAPGEEVQVLGEGDLLVGGDVLPGFSLAVKEIFAQIRV